MSESITVIVPDVDIKLLREQRDHLLEVMDGKKPREILNGVVNLLDAMLDIAEGYYYIK